MNVLVIDNYDSFTQNLCHLIARVIGRFPSVRRNDEIDVDGVRALRPDAIVLSPGPGHPSRARDFGVCSAVLESLPDVPVLGVCLGHQGIAQFSGGAVGLAAKPMHGLSSRIRHCGSGLFQDIPQDFSAVRYHSFVVARPLPAELEALAWSPDGEVMALRHKEKPFWGVQFHPESIATEFGELLLRNFFREIQRPVWVQEIYARFEPERIYVQLFAADEYSYWLDSARGGRYSFMGGSSVPGSYLLSYRADGTLFPDLRERLRRKRRVFEGEGFAGGFVGYLGFEMKRDCGFACAHRSELPDAQLLFAPAVLRFDHLERRIEVCAVDDSPELKSWGEELQRRAAAVEDRACPDAALPRVRPRFSAEAYRARVRDAMQEIRQGESYEVCLTDVFEGEPVADPLSYYRQLRQRNPAPYAAFLKMAGVSVACSSPERFLRVAVDRTITSKPIKGTAPVKSDPKDLLASAKDSAEHLMIVDLVRNDLGRVCEPCSVSVPVFRDVETYATVHQMVSTVEGRLRPECDVLDAIQAAFPAGSMTGAPKARTLEILDRLEAGPRGVYSGTIGWIGVNGTCDLNVVIRTAVMTAERTEVGSGGAIVALSEPERELAELRLKVGVLC